MYGKILIPLVTGIYYFGFYIFWLNRIGSGVDEENVDKIVSDFCKMEEDDD